MYSKRFGGIVGLLLVAVLTELSAGNRLSYRRTGPCQVYQILTYEYFSRSKMGKMCLYCQNLRGKFHDEYCIFNEHTQASLQGMANVYDYRATQSQFDGDNKETTDISARVTIFYISGQHPVKTICNRKKNISFPVIDGWAIMPFSYKRECRD